MEKKKIQELKCLILSYKHMKKVDGLTELGLGHLKGLEDAYKILTGKTVS